ncbi:hypothetical protein K435DRAFT_583367, partial [Dendrothele bispora CBS 962.96]
TILDGEKSSCIVDEQNNNNFTISSNVTGTLDTCQPWGIRIKGGVKPYTLVFAQLNASNVTNVTMPADADAYTYINRETPPWMLVDCGGLISSSGNATELDQPTGSTTPGSNDGRDSQKRTAVAAGVAVPVGVLLIAGL